MQIRLIDVMFRPVRTARKLIRLLKDVELQPVLTQTDRKLVSEDWVVLGGTYMIPSGVYNMICSSIKVVDYDWKTELFSLKKDQTLSPRVLSHGEIVAMAVAERLTN